MWSPAVKPEDGNHFLKDKVKEFTNNKEVNLKNIIYINPHLLYMLDSNSRTIHVSNWEHKWQQNQKKHGYEHQDNVVPNPSTKYFQLLPRM